MAFPKTLRNLHEAGYTFLFRALCRGSKCHAPVEWWETPEGRKMPLNRMDGPDNLARSHWSDCPNAQEFRKAKKAVTA